MIYVDERRGGEEKMQVGGAIRSGWEERRIERKEKMQVGETVSGDGEERRQIRRRKWMRKNNKIVSRRDKKRNSKNRYPLI